MLLIASYLPGDRLTDAPGSGIKELLLQVPFCPTHTNEVFMGHRYVPHVVLICSGFS